MVAIHIIMSNSNVAEIQNQKQIDCGVYSRNHENDIIKIKTVFFSSPSYIQTTHSIYLVLYIRQLFKTRKVKN